MVAMTRRSKESICLNANFAAESAAQQSTAVLVIALLFIIGTVVPTVAAAATTIDITGCERLKQCNSFSGNDDTLQSPPPIRIQYSGGKR